MVLVAVASVVVVVVASVVVVTAGCGSASVVATDGASSASVGSSVAASPVGRPAVSAQAAGMAKAISQIAMAGDRVIETLLCQSGRRSRFARRGETL